TPSPRLKVTLATTELLNCSPANTAAPGLALVGAFRVSRTVLSWKNVMVVPGCCTLRKMDPKALEVAETSAVFVALGATNEKSMLLSLNMANVLGVLKAGNRIVLGVPTFGLTSVKLPEPVSLLTA